MANRIRDVYVVNHRLDPHETELRILVEVENLTPTTEIRGRLMGPCCAFKSTVEIAYSMREVERGLELRVLNSRALLVESAIAIPVPRPVELWQDGERVDRVQISHGIRSIQYTPLGLRLNGQPIVLRCKPVMQTCSEADLLQLRTAGINTVITEIADSGGIELWNRADRCGLFVLGCTDGSAETFMRWKNELEKHPSNFAWAFCLAELTGDPRLEKSGATLYGVNTAGMTFPPSASFILTNVRDPNANQETSVPKILATRQLPNPLPSRPDVIGWIEYEV